MGNLTQKELAAAIAVSQPTVSYWLAGKAKPNRRSLLRLAFWFGVSVQSLMEGSNDEKN